MTTKSYLVIASNSTIVKKVGKQGAFKTQDMVEFIENTDFPEKSVIILDNVSFHHSQSVKRLMQSLFFRCMFFCL